MPGDDERASTDGRHISGSITGTLLRVVEGSLGRVGVERVLAAAGSRRSPDELARPETWSSFDEVDGLFVAAVAVTGDPEISARAGEELFRQYRGTEVAALLRSLGSPREVMRHYPATISKFTVTVECEVAHLEDTSALVDYRVRPGFRAVAHQCAFTRGALSQVSPLFDLAPAEVTELECLLRGGERCRFQVTWDPRSTVPDGDVDRRVAVLEGELAALTARFELLQATAAELIATRGVDRALEVIADRAGVAIRAPGFGIAVRVHDGEAARVHTVGLDDGRAAELTDALLADRVDDGDGSRLVVDIVAGGHRYGRLAAVHAAGGSFLPHERRLLEAFAAHAAAALETAAALELSQRRDRTARTLLGLGQALAEVTGSAEVCERTLAAVGDVVDCDSASLWLWDGEALRVAAMSDAVPADGRAALAGVRITAADTAVVEAVIEDPAPFIAGVDDPDLDPYLDGLLALSGALVVAVVPIASQGELFGALVAAVHDDPGRLRSSEDLLERLTGLAGIAATALRNARLLERIRFQALHDELTGLPNARLLEDRAERALRLARRRGGSAALLFLDLDRFKEVNDTLGHHAGDDLLRQVADRVRGVVRASDTVARLGGDEFVVLLPEVTDVGGATVVAEKLVARLAEPFLVEGERVEVGASVGVAVAPEHGSTFRELLRPADAAMYRAKTDGRGRVRTPDAVLAASAATPGAPQPG